MTLNPTFAPEVTAYAVTTGNATNKVTATPADENAVVKILLGEAELENGSSASWSPGENTLTVSVELDGAETTYTVTVTKS